MYQALLFLNHIMSPNFVALFVLLAILVGHWRYLLFLTTLKETSSLVIVVESFPSEQECNIENSEWNKEKRPASNINISSEAPLDVEKTESSLEIW